MLVLTLLFTKHTDKICCSSVAVAVCIFLQKRFWVDSHTSSSAISSEFLCHKEDCFSFLFYRVTYMEAVRLSLLQNRILFFC